MSKFDLQLGIDQMAGFILDQSPDFTLIIDKQYILKYINKSNDAYEKDSLIDTCILDALEGDQKIIAKAAYDRVFATGIPEQIELKALRSPTRDGFFCAYITRIKFGEAAGDHLLIYSRDITERKEMEQSMNYARHHLSVLQARVAGMQAAFRHDANNSVHTLFGLLSILEHKCSDADLLQYIDPIRESCKGLHSIIERYGSIYDEQKKLQEPMTVLNLGRILDMVTSVFKEACIEHGLQMSCILCDDLELSARESVLFQALYNIIDNAFKFAETEIVIRVQRDDAKLLITITDDGLGIDSQDEPYIFDAFFIGSGNVLLRGESGTGLGLAIAREQLQAINAQLYLDNEAPSTSFVIEF